MKLSEVNANGMIIAYGTFGNLSDRAYHWVGDYWKGPDWTAFYAANNIPLTEYVPSNRLFGHFFE
jgi:hypothetical protein